MRSRPGSLLCPFCEVGELAFIAFVLVIIGVIAAMVEAHYLRAGPGALLIGAPLAAHFASWPIALGQGLRALADFAECVRGQQARVR